MFQFLIVRKHSKTRIFLLIQIQVTSPLDLLIMFALYENVSSNGSLGTIKIYRGRKLLRVTRKTNQSL